MFKERNKEKKVLKGNEDLVRFKEKSFENKRKKVGEVIATIKMLRKNAGREEDYELFVIEQLFREILKRGSIDEAIQYIKAQKESQFSSLRVIWLYERAKSGDKKAEKEIEERKQWSKAYGWSG